MASKSVQGIVAPFLKNAEDYLITDQKEIVIACLKKCEEEIATVSKSLYVRKSGVAVGTIKGKDLIPHHELALSSLVSPNISFVDLTKEEALKYLRRQDLMLESTEQGVDYFSLWGYMFRLGKSFAQPC